MLTSDQERAFQLVKEGHNLYIGGQAGTGKSFLLTKLYDTLLLLGRKVSLTCTTGIACSAFPSRCQAKTIHRWSGMDDGRYSSNEICNLINNHVKYKETLERILSCEVLIVDEVSMLSKKLFQQLNEICTLKNKRLLFGGIQLIFCGDFVQLPPVKNQLYNDNGEYCFQSALFKEVFSHRIFLSDIKRQADEELIKTINEVSNGNLCDHTFQFIESVKRPLPFHNEQDKGMKLFSTNYLVDNFNRTSILERDGEMYEYESEDKGDVNKLNKILAKKKLWLKENCPVILLRNLSDKLVNGLLGHVVKCEKDGPTVYFDSIDVTTKMERIMFSVYSPIQKRNLAERMQFPLKLAFALTIHKAQGMTLDRVEIDCQQIFLPGQLGVAIGRVKSRDGLQVINFDRNCCPPQPSCIQEFMNDPSEPPDQSLLCCKKDRHIEEKDIILPEDIFLIDACNSEDLHDYDDENEFDEHFDAVIASISMEGLQENLPNLPEGFEIEKILQSLVTKTTCMLTPMQKDTNDAITLLLKHIPKVTEYASKEFCIHSSFIDSLNVQEGVPVKSDQLVEFYKKCTCHQASDAYKVCSLLLFYDISPSVNHNVVAHICFNITAGVRKFLLKEKEKVHVVQGSDVNQRKLNEASRGKVRYVGGYCIAKLRFQYMKQQYTNCYKTTTEGQEKYEEACTIVKILDTLRQSELGLLETSQHPETLLETSCKQNVSRGLTNISDEMYTFFMMVCEECLKLLIDKNLNVHGENLFKYCSEVILQSKELYIEFVRIVSMRTVEKFSDVVTTDTLLNEMVDTVASLELIFTNLVSRFLLVMFNQFRKDFLQAQCVEKKMAHRKQILVKSQKDSEKNVNKVNLSLLINDSSENKLMAHHLLKGMVLKSSKFLDTMKKTELVILCKAYNVRYTSKDTKSNLVKLLNEKVKTADEIENVQYLQSSQSEARGMEQITAATTPSAEHFSDAAECTTSQHVVQESDNEPSSSGVTHISTENEPGTARFLLTSSNEPQSKKKKGEISESVADPVNESMFLEEQVSETETDTCKICMKGENFNEQWIQCDSCSSWLHRKCAGLSNTLKWKKFNKRGSVFLCKDCK